MTFTKTRCETCMQDRIRDVSSIYRLSEDVIGIHNHGKKNKKKETNIFHGACGYLVKVRKPEEHIRAPVEKTCNKTWS